MAYLEKVIFDDWGVPSAESLEELTEEEWASWVNDELHGRYRFPISNGYNKGWSYPRSDQLLQMAIPELSETARLKAYAGIESCLDAAYDTLKNAGSDWGPEPLRMLFFLTGLIEKHAEDSSATPKTAPDNYFAARTEKLVRFLDILDPNPADWERRSPDHVDPYYTVLQALVNLKSKMPLDFWRTHLAVSPTIYATICLSGAAESSADDVLSLLPAVQWSDTKTRSYLGITLGHLVYSLRTERFGERLDALSSDLPPTAPEVISRALEYGERLTRMYAARETSGEHHGTIN